MRFLSARFAVAFMAAASGAALATNQYIIIPQHKLEMPECPASIREPKSSKRRRSRHGVRGW